jgi:hypothetical protein
LWRRVGCGRGAALIRGNGENMACGRVGGREVLLLRGREVRKGFGELGVGKGVCGRGGGGIPS